MNSPSLTISPLPPQEVLTPVSESNAASRVKLLLLPLMTVAIGWLDYITGWEWSLFVLYAGPILLAVWWDQRATAFGLAVFSAGIWWAANQNENPYETVIGYNLAMFSRLVYFTLAAAGGSAIRSKQAADATRIQMLEERRRLEQDFVAVSEHEQQRIGQDLHDGLCQHLAAIGCAARVLADELAAKGSAEAQDASFIEEAIKEAVLEARGLARGIFPVHVDRNGLSSALAELAASTTRLTGVRVHFIELMEVHVSDAEVAMHLYRIAQEAVANAVKHSGTAEVTVSVVVSGTQLELRIEDGGCGIPKVSRGESEGMGLRTMNYRAQVLGAKLSIEPRAEGGTVVRCLLKVRSEPNTQGS